jgi:maltose alpha-D-glucosyltransferase/alpha-amylase
LRTISATKIAIDRIRIHGNLDLVKVLYTGKDFVFLDFEGEPARPISERRFKRSPFRDIASMVRSFHYATEAALRSGRVRDEDVPSVRAHARVWERTIAGAFLSAYLEAAGQASFVPDSRDELGVLLDYFVLDKLLYEIGWTLDHRPDWLAIPLHGVLVAIGKEGEP